MIMNVKLKKLTDKIIIDSGFYDIVEKEEGEHLEKYEQDETYINRKKVPHKLTEEEFDKLISLKMINYAKSHDNKLNIIKNIMIFWLILTIINLIMLIYLIIRLLI